MKKYPFTIFIYVILTIPIVLFGQVNEKQWVQSFSLTPANNLNKDIIRKSVEYADSCSLYIGVLKEPSAITSLKKTGIKVNSQAIGTNTSTTFVNYLATIFAHEVGHTIGFRHTDYADRSFSCGGSTANEGASTVGAIYIPGTAVGPNDDPTSFMLACIGNGVNRPFNANDKTALNFLF